VPTAAPLWDVIPSTHPEIANLPSILVASVSVFGPSAGDVLEALALMDATAGDGDQFWELYADHLLPQPEDLTLPMCWTGELLQQLQHDAIIDAAQQQQVGGAWHIWDLAWHHTDGRAHRRLLFLCYSSPCYAILY
jgi:hypothetical protein